MYATDWHLFTELAAIFSFRVQWHYNGGLKDPPVSMQGQLQKPQSRKNSVKGTPFLLTFSQQTEGPIAQVGRVPLVIVVVDGGCAPRGG